MWKTNSTLSSSKIINNIRIFCVHKNTTMYSLAQSSLRRKSLYVFFSFIGVSTSFFCSYSCKTVKCFSKYIQKMKQIVTLVVKWFYINSEMRHEYSVFPFKQVVPFQILTNITQYVSHTSAQSVEPQPFLCHKLFLFLFRELVSFYTVGTWTHTIRYLH